MTAIRPLLAPLAGAAMIAAVPAQAQEEDPGKTDYYVLVGAGPSLAPSYPGSDDLEIGGFPELAVWEVGTVFPVESPDEGIGPVLFGERLGSGVGLTFAIAPTRSQGDIPGLDKVGFGIEAGGFAQTFLGPNLRARGEVRQAIGSHGGLVADAMLDGVVRSADDNLVLTAGPRVRWGNARFHRDLFGVDTAEALASGLPAYRPGSGLYAIGAATGAHYFLSPSLGLYAYGRYDRLRGDAADSPIVERGSRNQFETGVALTYRFRIRR